MEWWVVVGWRCLQAGRLHIACTQTSPTPHTTTHLGRGALDRAHHAARGGAGQGLAGGGALGVLALLGGALGVVSLAGLGSQLSLGGAAGQ